MAGIRTAPLSKEGAAGAPQVGSALAGWDTLERGRWHPSFLWHKVGAREALDVLIRLRSTPLQPPAGGRVGEGGGLDPGNGPRRAHFDEGESPAVLDLGCEELLEHLKTALGFAERVAHEERFPARPARFARPSPRACPGGEFCPAVQRALSSRGAAQGMFLHQAEAIDSILGDRQHTVIATSTASGK